MLSTAAGDAPAPRTIAVGVQDTPEGRDALALACWLAGRRGGEVAAVAVHHAAPPSSAISVPAYERALRDNALAELEAVLAAAPCDAVVRPVAEACWSVPLGLQRAAARLQAEILVVGSTHHGSWHRLAPGSVGARLLHGAPCPVAIAPRGHAGRPAPSPPPGEPIVGVAYDGTESSEEALLVAEVLGAALRARLRLITVVETTDAGGLHPVLGVTELLAERRREAAERLDEAVASSPVGLHADSALLVGEPAGALADGSENLDLLVCGSRGYGPVGQVLLGSVSGRLVNLAACPLMVVPRGTDGPLVDEALGRAEPAPRAAA